MTNKIIRQQYMILHQSTNINHWH